MISNFKQHYRGVTTSIVAPPVLLFAKVSARRAKYELKRREKTTNRNRNTLHNAASLTQSQSLMGATRFASGHFSAASSRVGFFSSLVPREKCNVHTLNKGSQIAVITLLSVSLCLKIRRGTRLLKNAPTRDASPPLELAFSIRLTG